MLATKPAFSQKGCQGTFTYEGFIVLSWKCHAGETRKCHGGRAKYLKTETNLCFGALWKQ